MSAPKDGGPAFPLPDDGRGWGSEGMSLRDWFAGQALTALLSHSQFFSAKETAEMSYAIAGMMLAARNAEGGAK